MFSLISLIDWILEILAWLIIIDVVLSYIRSIPQHHPAVVLLRRITRPVTSPFKKLVPPQRVGEAYVDFSPILAILAIWLIRMILVRVQTGLLL
ncbi:MAG: YggT family protein [Armatimonadetes bacterium]|nr:YggT family protein [Armatimonadota bacterium]